MTSQPWLHGRCISNLRPIIRNHRFPWQGNTTKSLGIHPQERLGLISTISLSEPYPGYFLVLNPILQAWIQCRRRIRHLGIWSKTLRKIRLSEIGNYEEGFRNPLFIPINRPWGLFQHLLAWSTHSYKIWAKQREFDTLNLWIKFF